MSLSASISAARAQGLAFRQALRPATVVLKLGTAHTSGSLAAVVIDHGLQRELDERGQTRRMQRSSVQIALTDLPDWATADALTNKGLCVTSAGTFKIGEAVLQEPALLLRCNRWPTA